jgi:hypothetical protein
MKKFHGISSVHNTGRSHSQITDSKKSPLSASTENNAAGCDSRHLAESCLIVSQPDSSQVFFCVSHCPRFACRYCHIGWTRIASGHGKPKEAPQKTSSFHGEVHWIVSHLPSRKGARLTLHGDLPLIFQKTLQEQNIVGEAPILSCTYVPTNLHAAWCYLQGIPVSDGEHALKGVAKTAGVSEDMFHNLKNLSLGLGP